MSNPTVAVFRPDDERLDRATDLLDSLGMDPLPDPMLAVEPTGARPREDADYTILTSKTGVELLPDGWTPGGALCAIGESTAAVLREAGYTVDIVPEEYTSGGLVDALAERVDGARIEVARSDHGSAVLLDGLESAGAYIHETVLYELRRPPEAGESAVTAADRDLDAALFSSSLTVENFLSAAADRDCEPVALAGLNDALVGVIGPPTAETAKEMGIDVDFVASEADFDVLAREAADRLDC
ncbi:uroporphyrinogen-III synthase [Halovenus sp. HT40]|uniref:uroporphyrinogen-III synthase n=1 Tax=Halovenus sp. HT40 TaxID=3126691 RepID=UPI00300F371C